MNFETSVRKRQTMQYENKWTIDLMKHIRGEKIQNKNYLHMKKYSIKIKIWGISRVSKNIEP